MVFMSASLLYITVGGVCEIRNFSNFHKFISCGLWPEYIFANDPPFNLTFSKPLLQVPRIDFPDFPPSTVEARQLAVVGVPHTWHTIHQKSREMSRNL